MSAKYRHWLPGGAYLDGTLETHFLSVTRDWARAWFTAGTPISLSLAAVEQAPRPAERGDGRETCWRTEDGRFLAWAGAAQKDCIAREMLGLAHLKMKPKPADQALFDALATAGLGALFEALSASIRAGRPKALPAMKDDLAAIPPDGFVLRVSAGALRTGLHTVLARDLLADCRKRLAPTRPASPAIESRIAALADETLSIGAFVGEGRIPAGQLEAMAPGDVLVLDTPTSSAFPLTINGQVRPVRTCTVERLEQAAAMRMRN